MIIISHRGNVTSIDKDRENKPEYVDLAIKLGYEVEIDIWKKNNQLYLGHDFPETLVRLEWLEERKNKLWIHTKNHLALEYFVSIDQGFKFFWHTSESFVLTSNCKIWAHDFNNVELSETCIVPLLSMEEVEKTKVKKWYAVCTDFAEYCTAKYRSIIDEL